MGEKRFFARGLTVLLCSAAVMMACGKADEGGAPVEMQPGPAIETRASAEKVELPSGLIIEDLTVGTGDEATTGSIVRVEYTGWLDNGAKFDSTSDHGRPFDFPLGEGRVIKGWDEGVAGMRAGGKRRLTIPPELAYGDREVPDLIPANSTLIFEIELIEVLDQ
jgi:FKBP-type peptidyl-prolyl cis-trans isomerase